MSRPAACRPAEKQEGELSAIATLINIDSVRRLFALRRRFLSRYLLPEDRCKVVVALN